MLPPRPVNPTFKRLPVLGEASAADLGVYVQAFASSVGELVGKRTVPWLAAQFWGRLELRRKRGPDRKGRRPNGVMAVVTYCGEERQIGPFLEHHRKLGVAEFVFLDLSADGALADMVEGSASCIIWRPRRPPKPEHALHWANYLRCVHGSGRWCLSLRPFERFVFFRCETRHIGDLLQFLESEQRDHMFALAVDMYAAAPATSIKLYGGQDPAEVLTYFDAFGYGAAEHGPHGSVVVRGGPLRRTDYRETPRASPPLNRTPLVKWHWSYSYLDGRRALMPKRLNAPHASWHSTPTACLLRYGLVDDDAAPARSARHDGAALVNNGGPNIRAGRPQLRQMMLKHDFSVRYRQSRDLAEAGLLNPGQWF